MSGETHSDTMCDPASPVTVSCSAMAVLETGDLATGKWSESGSADGTGNSGPIHPHCQTQCFTSNFKTSNGKLISLFVILCYWLSLSL